MCCTPRFSAAWAMLVLGLLAVPSGRLEAQQGRGDYRIRAIRTDIAPVLDGVLEEHVWGRGALIDELIQQEPIEGARATEDTEIGGFLCQFW